MFAAVAFSIGVGSTLGAASRNHPEQGGASDSKANDEDGVLNGVGVEQFKSRNVHVNVTEEEKRRIHGHGSTCQEEEDSDEDGEAERALLAAGPVLIVGFSTAFCHFGSCCAQRTPETKEFVEIYFLCSFFQDRFAETLVRWLLRHFPPS